MSQVINHAAMITQEPLSNCEDSLCIYCRALLYDVKVTRQFLYGENRKENATTNPFDPLPCSEKDWTLSSTGWKRYAYWPTIELFQSAAFADCHLCSQLYLQLEGGESNLAGDLVSFLVSTGESFSSIRLKLTYQNPDESPQNLPSVYCDPVEAMSINLSAEVAIGPSNGSPTPNGSRCQSPETCKEDTALPTSLNNPLSWRIVKDWVDECKTQHETCQENREGLHPDHQIPSRLIDVGFLEDFSDVRLCQTHTWPKETQWMTLSHCWGARGLKYKLTKATEQSFLQRICWETLPPSFRDAVTAARLIGTPFGVRYLWIDALCIIQDSLEPGGDWEMESKRMGAIYSWSFLTLAACTGPDSTSGLFPTRVKVGEHDCAFSLDIDGGREMGSTLNLKATLTLDTIDKSALKKRAWVVQELLLSRRILYFTTQECAWSCLSTCRSEKDPAQHHQWDLKCSNYFGDPGIWKSTTPSQGRETSIHATWGRIIGPYSRCSLTFSKDRIYAISGIAQQMKLMLNNEERYTYGLWTGKRFRWYLLWHVRQWPYRPRPKSNIPSWSWMSVANNVRYPIFIDRNTEWAADVELLESNNTTPREYGDNLLRVRGPLYKANSNAWFESFLGDRSILYWSPDDVHKLTATDDGDFTQPTSVYLLLIAKSSGISSAWNGGTVGLVVQKVNGKRGLFTRIAALTASEFREEQRSTDDAQSSYTSGGLMEMRQQPDAFGVEDRGGWLEKLDEDDYIAAHDDGKFTIHLA